MKDKTKVFRSGRALAGVLALAAALAFTGCPSGGDDDPAIKVPDQSEAVVQGGAGEAVYQLTTKNIKTAAHEVTVVWSAGKAPSGVTADTSVAIDKNKGTFKVYTTAATPDGSFEFTLKFGGASGKGKLVVSIPAGGSAIPQVTENTVALTEDGQTTVSFPLANPSFTEGEGWLNVYEQDTGGSLSAVIAYVENGKIVLENTGGLDAGDYYVSYQAGDDAAESARVHLVVTPKLAEGQTQTPIAVDSVVVKTTVTQGSVDVALSNASAYSASTAWKVYDDGFIAGSSANELAQNITGALAGTSLRLTSTADPANVKDGTYYVTAANEGESESPALKVVVKKPVSARPVFVEPALKKSSLADTSIVFTLETAIEGLWNVYSSADESSSAAPSGYSATSAGTAVTLAKSGGPLEGGDYYLAVTETGKDTSPRTKVQVIEYGVNEGHSTLPVFEEYAVDKATITQTTADYTVTNTEEVGAATWAVYSAYVSEDSKTPASGVTVSYTGGKLTLTGSPAGNPVPRGEYYITAKLADFAYESDPQKVTVTDPLPAFEQNFAVKANSTAATAVFTLTNGETFTGNTWAVYDAETGGAAVSGLSATVSGSVLMLTYTGSLPENRYYVCAVSGEYQSPRADLRVLESLLGLKRAEILTAEPNKVKVEFTRAFELDTNYLSELKVVGTDLSQPFADKGAITAGRYLDCTDNITPRSITAASANADKTIWTFTMSESAKFGEVLRFASAGDHWVKNGLLASPVEGGLIIKNLVPRVRGAFESEAGFYDNGEKVTLTKGGDQLLQEAWTMIKLRKMDDLSGSWERTGHTYTIVLDQDQKWVHPLYPDEADPTAEAQPPYETNGAKAPAAGNQQIDDNSGARPTIIITTKTGQATPVVCDQGAECLVVYTELVLDSDKLIFEGGSEPVTINAMFFQANNDGRIILNGATLKGRTLQLAGGSTGMGTFKLNGSGNATFVLINSGSIEGNLVDATGSKNTNGSSGSGVFSSHVRAAVIMHGGSITGNAYKQELGSEGYANSPVAGVFATNNGSPTNGFGRAAFYMTGGTMTGNSVLDESGAQSWASAGGVAIGGTVQKTGGVISGTAADNPNNKGPKAGAVLVMRSVGISPSEVTARDSEAGENDLLFMDCIYSGAPSFSIPLWAAPSAWDE